MNSVQKRRLLKLADMLEQDAKNKKGITFRLNVVISETGHDSFSVDSSFKPAMSCGTSACAMGLAAVSGKFKKAGLSYTYDKSEGIINTTWNGRITEYDKAAMKLFGLTNLQANYLFTPYYYKRKHKDGFVTYSLIEGARGERRVARRIRKLVASKLPDDLLSNKAALI